VSLSSSVRRAGITQEDSEQRLALVNAALNELASMQVAIHRLMLIQSGGGYVVADEASDGRTLFGQNRAQKFYALARAALRATAASNLISIT
jgi:hypothetical protein